MKNNGEWYYTVWLIKNCEKLYHWVHTCNPQWKLSYTAERYYPESQMFCSIKGRNRVIPVIAFRQFNNSESNRHWPDGCRECLVDLGVGWWWWWWEGIKCREKSRGAGIEVAPTDPLLVKNCWPNRGLIVSAVLLFVAPLHTLTVLHHRSNFQVGITAHWCCRVDVLLQWNTTQVGQYQPCQSHTVIKEGERNSFKKGFFFHPPLGIFFQWTTAYLWFGTCGFISLHIDFVIFLCLSFSILVFFFWRGAVTTPIFSAINNILMPLLWLSVAKKKQRTAFKGEKKSNFLLLADAKILVHAFVPSGPDYCIFLLTGCPSKSVKTLQLVQNAAGRVLTRTREEIIILMYWLIFQISYTALDSCTIYKWI